LIDGQDEQPNGETAAPKPVAHGLVVPLHFPLFQAVGIARRQLSTLPTTHGAPPYGRTAPLTTPDPMAITRKHFFTTPKTDLPGHILSNQDGMCLVLGLENGKSGGVVAVVNNRFTTLGLVLNLNRSTAAIMLLGGESEIVEGSRVYDLQSLLTIPATIEYFGHVIDPVGEFKDGTSYAPKLNFRQKVEQKAKGIIERTPVRIALSTGIKVIDSLVPIGRGQRELIIGDRQTGKTSIALDTILNHISINRLATETIGGSGALSLANLQNIVWFVYCGIGQKQSSVANIYNKLGKKGALWFTSLVVATAADSASLQFLAPYSACTLGEYIRDVIGGHCVAIYDDLSKHAVAYRQMSLLLRRPPGREAFPGDVFYIHSRLLERAGSLTHKGNRVRGTLTALPIIETQAGDVSAYIPTNVISITDGQLFLDTETFYKGIIPAVGVGLSVSRIGSAAQHKLMRNISGSLKMELAQYREIEGFAKLGANLDYATQRLLLRGEILVELLKQDLHQPLNIFSQCLSIYLGIGFSGKQALVADKNVQAMIKHSDLSEGYLVTGQYTRRSWLEILRAKSPDFRLPAVKGFIKHVTAFMFNNLQIGRSLQSDTFCELMNLIMSKLSFIYFYDFTTLFLMNSGQTRVLAEVTGDTEEALDAAEEGPFIIDMRDLFLPSTIADLHLDRGEAVDQLAILNHASTVHLEQPIHSSKVTEIHRLHILWYKLFELFRIGHSLNWIRALNPYTNSHLEYAVVCNNPDDSIKQGWNSWLGSSLEYSFELGVWAL